MNKPGEIEINAWKDLLAGMDGADSWGWESFNAAMKKSETFTPASDSIAKQGDITWNAASHGSKGPIHWSYPGYTFPYVGQWSDACAAAGLPASQDTYGGDNWGAYISTSCINPANWTRSYSRSGYLDPLPPRSNYDVLANAHVTKILFDSSSPSGNLSANAVEFTSDNGASKTTVKVKREVVLAGGTVGSPTVLLHSGIGPKDILSAAGVPLVFDLPGVGQHLQDHVSVSLQWDTDQPTAGSMYEDEDPSINDPAFLSYINSAVAYAGADILFGDQVAGLKGTIMGQMEQYTPDSSSDPSVVAGYEAIYSATANTILPSKLGLVELLAGNNVDGAIRIGAALQHPFSHGSITISSANPMDYPVIDPSYLKHPADVQILREGLKLTRKIGQTQPLSSSMTNEVLPGEDVQSDEDWDKWLRGQIFTEFHPSSTCSMLPFEQGGVVDANLRVYGLANVRVADASVPPISFSAHLMGSTYGIAEQASNIIRRSHNIQPSTKKNGTSSDNEDDNNDESGGDTRPDEPSPSADNGGNSRENGASPSQKPWPVLLAGIVALASAFLT